MDVETEEENQSEEENETECESNASDANGRQMSQQSKYFGSQADIIGTFLTFEQTQMQTQRSTDSNDPFSSQRSTRADLIYSQSPPFWSQTSIASSILPTQPSKNQNSSMSSDPLRDDQRDIDSNDTQNDDGPMPMNSKQPTCVLMSDEMLFGGRTHGSIAASATQQVSSLIAERKNAASFGSFPATPTQQVSTLIVEKKNQQKQIQNLSKSQSIGTPPSHNTQISPSISPENNKMENLEPSASEAVSSNENNTDNKNEDEPDYDSRIDHSVNTGSDDIYENDPNIIDENTQTYQKGQRTQPTPKTKSAVKQITQQLPAKWISWANPVAKWKTQHGINALYASRFKNGVDILQIGVLLLTPDEEWEDFKLGKKKLMLSPKNVAVLPEQSVIFIARKVKVLRNAANGANAVKITRLAVLKKCINLGFGKKSQFMKLRDWHHMKQRALEDYLEGVKKAKWPKIHGLLFDEFAKIEDAKWVFVHGGIRQRFGWTFRDLNESNYVDPSLNDQSHLLWKKLTSRSDAIKGMKNDGQIKVQKKKYTIIMARRNHLRNW